jgi:GNAT superfamily N-acetyltransferase
VDIVQVDAQNRRQVQQWLDLPFRLYRDIPQWVPPMDSDARLAFDRQRHPFYEHSEAAFFMAMVGERAVGRIAALDNRNFNSFHGQNTAFFYLFECEDEREVSRALFTAATDWARQRGLTRIIGPKGFTTLDGMGLLVKGFEHRPALGIAYNPAYYEALILEAGFERFDDDVSGYISSDLHLPERVHDIAARVRQRRKLSVPTYTNKSQLKAILPQVRDLYNRSLGRNFDQMPITEGELRLMADQLLPIADPRLIKLVMKGNDPIGFVLAYPDPSAAIQRTKGRLWPFGWADLLLELRRTKWLNVNGAGILPEYQGLGGMALLLAEMENAVRASRCEHAEIVQISVNNDKMQGVLRDLGINFYKIHRVYQRNL